MFPGTLYGVRKFMGFDRDNFTKYVVCQNCYALYKYDNILVEVSGDTIIRKCYNLKIRKKGKFQCGGQLLRKVSLSSGKSVYYPLNVYCYKGVIDHLQEFLLRLDLKISDQDTTCKTRFALLFAATDIPAARKLCGFLGHSATQGCSHCTKKITNSKGERNCGGFDFKTWIPRTKEDHYKHSQRIKNTKTLTQKKNIEKEFGYRYTVFLELDYFKPSRFLTIDPMHNLFLGTAKKMFSYWVDEEILKKKDLEKITAKIKSLNVTSDVGRLPENIATNYGQFTAKEWKNWVIIYSILTSRFGLKSLANICFGMYTFVSTMHLFGKH
ncbi:hypothetical protein KUTeg_006211 [Tegillarca granosa]|uniref:Transposase n=1 Tax=Tegillarca granosa TaxID=220873 RepID=A0ABQ9FJT8_TEGGR|nr:hypothetical protein KUTeg_006211 [Tegillarca granosa]